MSLSMIRYILIFFVIFTAVQPAQAADADNALYYLEKGKLQFNEEMYSFSQEYLERALKLDPSLYEAANYLGEIALKKKRKIAAFEYFKYSLSIKDDQESAQTRMGDLSDYFMNQDEAFAHFSAAYRLNPSNSRALLGLSRCYSLAGKIEDAERCYKQSFELKQDDIVPILKKGETAYKNKKYSEALSLFYQSLEINPAQRETYYTIATIERIRRKPAEAVAIIEQLAYFRPHDFETLFYLANMYYSENPSLNKHKDLESAIVLMKRVIALKKNSPDYYEFAADLLNAIGNEKERDAYRIEAEKIRGRKTNP